VFTAPNAEPCDWEKRRLVRLGLDLGPQKSHLAVVRVGERTQVLFLATLESGKLKSALKEILTTYEPGVAVVEDVGKKPLKGRMGWEEWRRMRSLVDRMVAFLGGQGLLVLTPRAVVQGAWYTGEEPGWRQSFTGLTYPHETDVMRRIQVMAAGGHLEGSLPQNLHQADALAMAIWSMERDDLLGGREG
jgi:Holliday junction resolvasome RuvABC endonuclease subunit